MPLTGNVQQNIKELYADNKRSGKARGANGKPRTRAQIIAIAENAAGEPNHIRQTRANQHKLVHR